MPECIEEKNQQYALGVCSNTSYFSRYFSFFHGRVATFSINLCNSYEQCTHGPAERGRKEPVDDERQVVLMNFGV